MDRKAAGGLASLTANYTDSDASDGEDDDGYAEDETTAGEKNAAATSIINGTTNDLSYLTTESNTNSVSEMGHITDEEMSGGEEESRTEGSEGIELSQDVILDNVQLPPEPPGWCSKQLQEKIAMKYEKMLRDGEDLNQQIQNQKQFRNPSIYEKLIQFCQIDEMGTNHPQDVLDTRQFDSSSYYEELAKAQMVEMDKVMEKRKKEQKERTKIEFISGTKKPSLVPLPIDSRADESKKRKSKWDVAAVVGAPSTKPSTGTTSTTTVAPTNGSKSTTVISAYGTIAKKTKT